MHDSPARAEPSPGVVPPRGTVLGFDFGTARIGVAVAELELGIAHPLETIASSSEEQRERALDRLITDWRPALLVLGLPPPRPDGTGHPLAPVILAWAARLGRRSGLEVRFVDESLTSAMASTALAESGIRGIRQKRYLDSVAAQQILQSFLDGCHAPA
jgi:putative Holliday junction resolvase